LNINLPNGDFEISWKLKPTASSNAGSFIEVSNGSRRTALMGQYGSNGVNGFRSYYGTGTYDFNELVGDALTTNVETKLIWQHEGTTDTYTVGSQTKTLTNDTQTHSKLTTATIQSNNSMKELLIKAL
jgi:hypothetical protein